MVVTTVPEAKRSRDERARTSSARWGARKTPAGRRNAGPKVVVGDVKRRAGRVFVDMTGGTEGPKEIFERLTQAGVGTVVGMHLSEEHLKNIKQENMNVVIAGHIASDTLGLNLLLDKLVKKERALEITACSGFRRFKR